MKKEKMLHDATLVFLVRYRNNKREICLAQKTRHIGEGRLNGYGGGVEENETNRWTAIAELFDESKVIAKPDDLQKVAIILVRKQTSEGEKYTSRVHVYFLSKFIGEPRSTEEMKDPWWFEESEFPFEKMMPADKYWMKPVLEGQPIFAKFPLSPFEKELTGKVRIRPLAPKYMID